MSSAQKLKLLISVKCAQRHISLLENLEKIVLVLCQNYL